VHFKDIRTRSVLIPYGRPVTITLPTNKLNLKQIHSSLMPNLIHSLDASNIHLLCEHIKNKNIELYTIHDCFATTANNMENIENEIKISFIEIYFKDKNYLEKMHENILDQIRSYKTTEIKDGKEIININNEIIEIPEIPASFLDKKLVNVFIQGIKRSKFFIS
jgi:DNA-directed RNA polymerase